MWLLCLVPFSNKSKMTDENYWHIVIFNKWIKTRLKLSRKWETQITADGIYINFMCRWLKPNYYSNFSNDRYFNKFWKAPWSRECFDTAYYIHEGWQWLGPLKPEEHLVFDKICDKYKTKFKYMDGDKKIEVGVTLYGVARKYAPVCLPKFLKPIYCYLFRAEHKNIEISLSHDDDYAIATVIIEY